MVYMPSVRGYSTTVDPISPHVSDYLVLSKNKFSSGGTESYFYEPHDYSYFVDYIPTSYPAPTTYIGGKRLRKKETITGSDVITVNYKYRLHDENYQQLNNGNSVGDTWVSSGILVNPSIHNSTIYQQKYDIDRYFFLEASTFYSEEPQNSPFGLPIYYSEVEEVFSSGSTEENGKKIYFFAKMYATPPTSYLYSNYQRSLNSFSSANHLLGLQNMLKGKQTFPSDPVFAGMSNQNFTFMNYPVGNFHHSQYKEGKLVKEVTLNAGGEIVKKVENEYTPGDGLGQTLYGLVVKKFDDNDYAINPYPATPINRYLISQTKTTFGVYQLVKTSTTNYLASGPVTQEQIFNYSGLNLLKSTVTSQSTGGDIVKEYIYPHEITFNNNSSLSQQALSINTMKAKNVVGTPVQTTLKKGTQFIGGNYTTFKQLPVGAMVADSVFSLVSQAGTTVSAPIVNSAGRLIRNSNFKSDAAFPEYDGHGNLVTQITKEGAPETLIWGYAGQYPVAKISNYTYAQVQANATLSNQLELLDDFTAVNTDAHRSSLTACNQAIRSSLPSDVIITTYTYNPLVGMTSASDSKGQTSYYEYDIFNRLSSVKNHNGDIIKQYCYNYAGQQQPCFTMQTPGGAQTVYIRAELHNVQSFGGRYPEVFFTAQTGHLVFRFFADAACTQPFTLTSPLTFNYTLKTSHSYTGGSSPATIQPYSVIASSGESSLYIGQVNLSYYEETYDSSLGTIYNNWIYEYILQPGQGYQPSTN